LSWSKNPQAKLIILIVGIASALSAKWIDRSWNVTAFSCDGLPAFQELCGAAVGRAAIFQGDEGHRFLGFSCLNILRADRLCCTQAVVEACHRWITTPKKYFSLANLVYAEDMSMVLTSFAQCQFFHEEVQWCKRVGLQMILPT